MSADPILAAKERLTELALILKARGHVLTMHDQERADAIDTLLAELSRLEGENERLRKVVGAAQAQFESYAQSHKAKGTPDGDDKALTNARFALMCAEALQAPQSQGGEA